MDDVGCFLLLLLIGVGAIALQIYKSNLIAAARKALSEAKAACEASLSELRRDPTNTQLRQRSLELGRHYSNLGRNKEGVAIFDEVALMNDITAAVGSTAVITSRSHADRPSEPLAATRPSSIEQRLERLSSLRDQGLITGEEYEARRGEILKEL